ncbi:hypothetical protein PENTCL1PPCAC_26313, partial [Pristionchus entomophagus]
PCFLQPETAFAAMSLSGYTSRRPAPLARHATAARSMVETVQFVAEYPDGGRQEAEGRSSHGRRDDGARGRSDAADGGRPLSISLQTMTKSTIDKVAVHIIES